MPPLPWLLPPGFDRRSTKYASEGRYVDGDKIRFRDGFPEKLGGWTKLVATQFTGKCRGLHAWRDNIGRQFLAVGTHVKLYVYDAAVDTLLDVTPLRDDGTLTDPFDVVDTSATVTVNHNSHGLNVGDYVTFSDADAVGGITPDGNYVVVTVPDSDSYTITHSAAATSTVNGGGGSVTYEYELPVGREDAEDVSGYGIGAYGSGGYGEDTSGTVPVGPRVWVLDHFGENLQAVPYPSGNVYEWVPGAARATMIANAPTGSSLFVTEKRHLTVLGAGNNSMRVHNSDAENNTTWDAAETNQARRQVLSGGNRLVGGCAALNGINILWSDTHTFTMQFLSSGAIPFRYDAKAAGTGIVGPNAWCFYLGLVYWMGPTDFWMYDGFVRFPPRVQEIRNYIFGPNGDLNTAQQEKVQCSFNPAFQEVWWFYPSASSTECDKYVKLNVVDQAWDTGTLDRTAFTHATILSNPIGASAAGYLYRHESGVDDDGSAMYSWIEAAPGDLDDGRSLMDVNAIQPNFSRHVGSVRLYCLSRNYPDATPLTEGPFQLLPGDTEVDLRANGRQVGLKLESQVVGGDWRMGKALLDAQMAGMR